jgi:hypothetical protein
MPDHLAGDLGDKRETLACSDAIAQRVYQIGHHGSVSAERPQMDTPHSFYVTWPFFAKIHSSERKGTAPMASLRTMALRPAA